MDYAELQLSCMLMHVVPGGGSPTHMTGSVWTLFSVVDTLMVDKLSTTRLIEEAVLRHHAVLLQSPSFHSTERD